MIYLLCIILFLCVMLRVFHCVYITVSSGMELKLAGPGHANLCCEQTRCICIGPYFTDRDSSRVFGFSSAHAGWNRVILKYADSHIDSTYTL
jgi:hypothetical protein